MDRRAEPMRVHLNGEAREIPAGSTLADLLRILRLPGARVAVELNHRVVPRRSHEKVFLEDGDRLELVHFIGGG